MPPRKNEGLSVFILEKGLALTFLLAPLLFGSVYHMPALLLSALLFFLLMIFPDALGAFYVLPGFFRYGMLAVFVFVLLQVFFLSMNRSETLSELLLWSALAAGFLILQCLPEASLKRLLAVIVILGVLESAYGLFQLHSGSEAVLWKLKEAHRGFVTGTYLNRNHLAGLLEMCLGVQMGFFLSAFCKRNKSKMIFLGLALIISLTAFIETSSRMGILSFFLSFLFMAFFLPLPSNSKGIYLLLSVVVIGGLWHGGNVLSLRLRDLDEGLGWDNGRFAAWRDALPMLRDHAWVGVGLGNFKWVFPNYQSENLLMHWSHVHQDYLELAIELGIPAAVLFLLSFAGLWGFVLRTYRQPPPLGDETIYPLIWGGLLGLLSFALHGLTDFNFAIPANAMIFVFLLGILNRKAKVSHSPGKVSWIPRLAAVFLMILCVQRAWARPANNPSQLTQEMPFYGRGWLQLGLSRLQLEASSSDGLTAAEWPAIRDLFESAYQKEPGSAWMAYMTGRVMLSYSQYLAAEEKKSALERIRKSTSIHYPHQAAFSLGPALEFLWNRFSSFGLLRWITPHEFASYQVLLAFTERHNLSRPRAEIFPEFERMRKAEYERRCEQAQKWFGHGDYQKAMDAYQDAYWIGQEWDRAKLGRQAAKAELEKRKK